MPISSGNLRLLAGAMLIGAAWFLSGFVGSIVLVPGSDQGPLFGICLTGPAGLIFGVVVGALTTRPTVSDRRALQIIGLVALIGSIAILAYIALGAH